MTGTGVLTDNDIIRFDKKTSKLFGIKYRQRSFNEVKELTGRRLAYAARVASSGNISFPRGSSFDVTGSQGVPTGGSNSSPRVVRDDVIIQEP